MWELGNGEWGMGIGDWFCLCTTCQGEQGTGNRERF